MVPIQEIKCTVLRRFSNVANLVPVFLVNMVCCFGGFIPPNFNGILGTDPLQDSDQDSNHRILSRGGWGECDSHESSPNLP